MALSLTENWIDGCVVNLLNQMPGAYTTANTIVDFWINRLLGRALSSTANRTRIVDFMRGAYTADFVLSAAYIEERLPRMIALIIMAPDFYYR
jgi:hypothetical protein